MTWNCERFHYSTVQSSAWNIQSCLINMCLFCQKLRYCPSFFAFMSHNYFSPYIFSSSFISSKWQSVKNNRISYRTDHVSCCIENISRVLLHKEYITCPVTYRAYHVSCYIQNISRIFLNTEHITCLVTYTTSRVLLYTQHITCPVTYRTTTCPVTYRTYHVSCYIQTYHVSFYTQNISRVLLHTQHITCPVTYRTTTCPVT
jgi:hypothetical protein